MKKAESALRQQLARLRQAGKAAPASGGTKPTWEHLLDKALEKEAAPATSSGFPSGGGGKQETGGKSSPQQRAQIPEPVGQTESLEIGAWSMGAGIRDEKQEPSLALPQAREPAPLSPAFIKRGKKAAAQSVIATTRGPRQLVILRPDSIGDLILFEPVLRLLRQAWPSTRIHLVATPTALTVSPLFPEGIEWHTVENGMPFGVPNRESLAALRLALGSIGPGAWLLSACPRKTWWDMAAPALAHFDRKLSLGQVPMLETWSTALAKAGLDDKLTGYLESIGISSEMHEWKKNLEFASYLLGCSVPESRPHLQVPAAMMEQSRSLLSRLDLERGKFIACCPAGTSNVAIKTWPAQRFAEVLLHLAEKRGLGILVFGTISENDSVAAVLRHVEAGGRKAAVWLGQSADDFSVLCALLSDAALYLGNDTGPMHAAAALDRPVVGIFGGGTWPRFLPCALRGAAVVRRMPCFGCDWQCHLGDAPCIHFVETDTVIQAALEVLEEKEPKFTIVEEKAHAAPEIDDLSRNAAHHARSLRGQVEHLGRVAQDQADFIEQLGREKESLTAALKEKQTEVEERLAVLLQQESYISQLKAELQRETDALKESAAAHDTESQQRLATILEQSKYIALIEAERSTLKDKAAELERRLDAHTATETSNRELSRIIAEKDAELQDQKRRCVELEQRSRSLSEQVALLGRRYNEMKASLDSSAARLAALQAEREQDSAENSREISELRAALAETRDFARYLEEQYTAASKQL